MQSEDEMKTYAETRTKGTFNWNKFLAKETYTSEELYEAYLLSGDWVTCAVGNQCACLLRDSVGHPTDSDLALFGYRFHSWIEEMKDAIEMNHTENFDKAKATAIEYLKKIEERSKLLIDDINARNN